MKNPVIEGNYADLFVYRDGSDYYMVATTEKSPYFTKENGEFFEIYHSKDLQNWSEPKKIIEMRNIPWSNGSWAWAPSLTKYKDHWYLATCTNSQIGIAVCDTPDGVYRDVMGESIIGVQMMGVSSIDPSLFVDEDGKAYLMWGNSALFMSEIYLSPDDVHLVGEIRNLSEIFYEQKGEVHDRYKPWVFCEGADLIKYNGRYLLSWSINDFRDPNYNIRYAWADNVWGPYVQPKDENGDNIIIKRPSGIVGTGHGNITEMNGYLYVCYHRHQYDGDGKYVGRQACINKIEINGDILSANAT